MTKLGRREILALLVLAGALLAVAAAVVVKDTTRDWTYYQAEFRAVVAEYIGEVEPAAIPRGIQQIWVAKLNRVDRCMTCHQGILWKGLEQVEQPWRTHPKLELFQSHPVEHYGCTICHGGQGYALTEWEAHGFIKHWEEPLLSATVGREYDLRDPPPLWQSNCNYCHRHERETHGMDYINHAKSLMRKKGCKICHIINGEGGTLGPDLTFIGDKSPVEFDFSNFATDQMTVFNWHVNHFQSPMTVVPATIMPELNLQSKDAQALAMLVMSWRDLSALPREYLPGVALRDEMTAEEIEQERRMREGDGAFFVEHSCFVCHSIKAFDIKSPTEKGPDLSYAPDDVRARFSKSLDEFLFEPTGTMKIILESQIVLTEAQKWEAIEKIRKAYAIVKSQDAAAHAAQ